MGKKITIISLLLFILLIPAASFAEIGVGAIIGEPTGLSFKLGNFPVIGLGWSTFNSSIDATVDMWFINDHFVEMLDWYLGVGAKLGIKSNDFLIGIRVPIGAQWWLTNEFELFAEIAPGLAILPATEFDISGGIGLRYHF